MVPRRQRVTAPRLHVLIPCARPWNIGIITQSYLQDMEKHPFEVRLHVLGQGPEPDPKGMFKVNEALAWIPDGWVMFSTDDTFHYPSLFRRLHEVIRSNTHAQAVVFTEVRHFGTSFLRAAPENMCLGNVCAGVIWNRQLIGHNRFDFERHGEACDGRFIEMMFRQHRSRFVFVDEPLVCFGRLEWGIDTRP